MASGARNRAANFWQIYSAGRASLSYTRVLPQDNAAKARAVRGMLALTSSRRAPLQSDYRHATVDLAAGTHSPWLSRYLTERGATVIVDNRASSTPSPGSEG